jgi:1-acyl-sn-glycerol-3-phosphate acyltransferase
MGKENIEKYSFGYALLKLASGFWHNVMFYRKVIVIGRDNINPDDHLIFAPNHQNTLMDALAILYNVKGQPVFLARADIFRKKTIAAIMYFLKILPVYRLRDGFENVRSNDEIFNKTIDVLKNKNGLVVLPEGTHEGIRCLRQLKKGIFRIALQADEAMDFNLKIKIIPVGLDYSDYYGIRQILTVVYGEPIEVSQFHDTYRQNPPKALNDLRELLSAEMKKYMVNIESDEDYEALDEIRSIINGKYASDRKQPKVFRDRILINKLKKLKDSSGNTYRDICALSIKIKESVTSMKIDNRSLDRKKSPLILLLLKTLGLIAGFPLFLYGLIFNGVLLYIPSLLTHKFKDKQFLSSVKFLVSFIVALLLGPVYLILLLVLITPWWLALAVFISIPISGLFAWSYIQFYRGLRISLRASQMMRKKDEEYTVLRKSYTGLVSLISNI